MLGRIFAIVILGFGAHALAQAAFPGVANWRVANLSASAVVVDVVDAASGVQVANNVATTRLQVDGVNTDLWKFNLASVPGYPTSCTLTTYALRWVPDSADCSSAGTPGLCVEERALIGGPDCEGDPAVQESVVHATSITAAQGITRDVFEYHRRRGLLPIKWREIRRAADRNFAAPDLQEWLVYFYSQSGEFPTLKCVVSTTTDPAVSLPSSSSCVGAP